MLLSQLLCKKTNGAVFQHVAWHPRDMYGVRVSRQPAAKDGQDLHPPRLVGPLGIDFQSRGEVCELVYNREAVRSDFNHP